LIRAAVAETPASGLGILSTGGSRERTKEHKFNNRLCGKRPREEKSQFEWYENRVPFPRGEAKALEKEGEPETASW